MRENPNKTNRHNLTRLRPGNKCRMAKTGATRLNGPVEASGLLFDKKTSIVTDDGQSYTLEFQAIQ
jgi:hypothetical protein